MGGSYSFIYNRIDNETEWNQIEGISKTVSNKQSENDCSYLTNYATDPDDVVIGQHQQNYTGLTEVTFEFINSTLGAAFLNKYTDEHSHKYGYREHTVDACLLCAGDGNSITKAGYEYTTLPQSDGTYSEMRCLSNNINYRPKLCSVEDFSLGVSRTLIDCEQDWDMITPGGSYDSRICSSSSGTYNTHGLFMKTNIYDSLLNGCGEQNENDNVIISTPAYEYEY